MTLINVPKLPPFSQPLLDEGGAMTQPWRDYFQRLDHDLRRGGTTVAGLPSAVTSGAGARAFVTDASATTFNSTVAGGGANKVPVVSDGTNWLIG